MPIPLHPLVARAREALARGDFRVAETAAEERLKTAGRDTNALAIRVAAQQRRGQFGEAARTLQSVIAIDAGADWAHNDLIQLLHAHGRREDAEQVARAALAANPDNAQANNYFGLLLSEANALPAGEWHFRRALELAGPTADVLTNLGRNLTDQGRFAQAEACFAQAHQIAPEEAGILTQWARHSEQSGDPGRAEELLDRAQTLSSAESVCVPRAELLAGTGRNEEALLAVDAAADSSGTARLLRGRLYDRLGRYGEAWTDFAEGQRKRAAEGGGLQYKADAVEALFGRLTRFFTRARFSVLPRAPARGDTAQPIFILGLPFSGTAAVERLLGSHDQVRAGGELAFTAELHKLAGHLLPSTIASASPGGAAAGAAGSGATAFPDNLALSASADNRYVAKLLRDYYLARAEECGLSDGGKPFFTDRTPFAAVHLPLLKMAFPQAKFVHVVRHPLDVCLALMSNALPPGFNCGYRIEDVAHYVGAFSDLTESYRQQLESPDWVLKYEALVGDPADESARLLDYLGLPPQSGLGLAPDEAAVGAYQHYARPLKPAAARLERAMALHGYTSPAGGA